MKPPRHLLTVWNPSYADDSMDQHLEVLLRWASRWREQKAPEDDVYVWWAKLRSVNRTGALPHLGEVLTLEEQLKQGIETHLYLTDYRSLYVGLLTEITTDPVPQETPAELEHMPGYYQGRAADCWFRLADLRLLVVDDTVAVIEALKPLRNVRYHDRPVSLYGGVVDLPLIVTRSDGQEWFADRGELVEGRLWVEHDSELRGETARMEQDLRDNCIGPVLWSEIEPTTRLFLASAEAVYRTRHDDPGFDFTGPALGYSKAVETELNRLIFPVLRKFLQKASPNDREIVSDGRRIDLGGPVAHQSLGTLQFLLKKDELMIRQVRTVFANQVAFLLGSLPGQLNQLVEVRNPGAHSAPVSAARVQEIRSAVLGIGCDGLINQIARVKLQYRARM
ncbi:MAG TPA: hypothetical protein VF862_05550 [Gemmatimonadales bacterium]